MLCSRSELLSVCCSISHFNFVSKNNQSFFKDGLYIGCFLLLFAPLSFPFLPFTTLKIPNLSLDYSFVLRNNWFRDHLILLPPHVHSNHLNNSFLQVIILHDVKNIVANTVNNSFLDELGMKLTTIKVYEVELLMYWKLHYLPCHNEWLCHMFGVYDLESTFQITV